jgi:kojibiose phosphorylase
MEKYIFDFSNYKYGDDDVIATLTTLSNGHISIRGDFEFMRSIFGTIVSGIYSYVPIFYRELVNLPRITSLSLTLDGEPLTLNSITGFIERTLNTYEGTLKHKFAWKTTNGVVNYESIRLAHKKVKPLFAMRIYLRSKNASGKLCITSSIDLNTLNRSIPKNVFVKLFRIINAYREDQKNFVSVETEDQRYTVYFGLLNKVSSKWKKYSYINEDSIGDVLCVDVKPGDEYTIEKYVAIDRSMERVHKILNELTSSSFEKILTDHKDAWSKEWNGLGIKLDGDKDFEKSLIFNTFHLLQLYNDEAEYFMLPARGLHGYGYHGHVFWDADVYALPFYLLIKPEAAKKMLKFRCKTLDAAKINAKQHGFKGAQYPWESTDDGLEATPKEVPLDLLSVSKVIIETGDLEHHITADIAYITDLYYRVTGDVEFMKECGLKIIFETARFWASRVEFDKSKNAYVINNVIGPDEYHSHVNNNFYTNIMAQYNLELGVKYYEESLRKEEWIRVINECRINDEEVNTWKEISSKLFLPCKDNGFCEEFEGYENLEDSIIHEGYIGEKFLPNSEKSKIGKNKLIKQGDVILAMFLLRDRFNKEAIELNYDYYVNRTTHASSLSLPSYAMVAAYLGKINDAYKMLKIAVDADLKNIYENTSEGFHVASAGGVWTAILFGILGIDINNNELHLKPKLPKDLNAVGIKIIFRGKKYLINATHEGSLISELKNEA